MSFLSVPFSGSIDDNCRLPAPVLPTHRCIDTGRHPLPPEGRKAESKSGAARTAVPTPTPSFVLGWIDGACCNDVVVGTIVPTLLMVDGRKLDNLFLFSFVSR